MVEGGGDRTCGETAEKLLRPMTLLSSQGQRTSQSEPSSERSSSKRARHRLSSLSNLSTRSTDPLEARRLLLDRYGRRTEPLRLAHLLLAVFDPARLARR